MAAKAYDAVEFKNHKGHVLKPGDSSVAVTKSAGQASLVSGRYLGLRNGNCVMAVDKVAVKMTHDVTGEEYDWLAEANELPYPRYDYYSRDPAVRDAYNEKMAIRKDEIAKRRQGYSNKDFPYVGSTTLQLNKIYPGEIKAKDLSL